MIFFVFCLQAPSFSLGIGLTPDECSQSQPNDPIFDHSLPAKKDNMDDECAINDDTPEVIILDTPPHVGAYADASQSVPKFDPSPEVSCSFTSSLFHHSVGKEDHAANSVAYCGPLVMITDTGEYINLVIVYVFLIF